MVDRTDDASSLVEPIHRKVTIALVKNVGIGKLAALATYVVEKGETVDHLAEMITAT